MAPSTRLDRLVRIRERREDTALVDLARAQEKLDTAEQELARRHAAARADKRAAGAAVLWDLDDAAHRRALQAVRNAQAHVADAARGRDVARARWSSAHQDTEAASRIAERKRSEIVADRERRERRGADEIAVMRYVRGA